MGEKKPELSAMAGAGILLGIASFLVLGRCAIQSGFQEARERSRLYQSTFEKADKNRDGKVDPLETHYASIGLKVNTNTNICLFTTFEKMYNRATIENISNYISRK